MDHALQNKAKKNVAIESLKLIKNKMKIGIGTGSTINFLIEALKDTSDSKELSLAFSSIKSERLLQDFSYRKIDDKLEESLDLAIDGADYIDHQGNIIKGGGGALTREKIVIAQAKKTIIVIDESKLCLKPKKVTLPIEILPFGFIATIQHLNLAGQLRKNADGTFFTTDNHNYIFDATIQFPLHQPLDFHQKIKQTIGVVETGLFFIPNMEVWIAFFDEKKGIQKLIFNN
jgi:ribose 5-phosphate isomerase A